MRNAECGAKHSTLNVEGLEERNGDPATVFNRVFLEAKALYGLRLVRPLWKASIAWST